MRTIYRLALRSLVSTTGCATPSTVPLPTSVLLTVSDVKVVATSGPYGQSFAAGILVQNTGESVVAIARCALVSLVRQDSPGAWNGGSIDRVCSSGDGSPARALPDWSVQIAPQASATLFVGGPGRSGVWRATLSLSANGRPVDPSMTTTAPFTVP